MTKSELIETIAARQSQLSSKDVELAVKTILEHMSQALSTASASRYAALAVFRCTIASPVAGATPRPVTR